MTLGEFREFTKNIPDNYEIVDFYTDLLIDDIDIEEETKKIYLIQEDD